MIKSPNNELVAMQTLFGWVISGSASVTSQNQKPMSVLSTHHISLDHQLRKFWEIDEINPSCKAWSIEEKESESHFVTNTIRDSDGRYQVKLPFKSHVELGDRKSIALRRFKQIEPRLDDKYREVMQEYLDLGHAELVPTGDKAKSCGEVFYLPHHSVSNESSSTTKLRVVFDASAKTDSGMSLNDCLMVGPKIPEDLFNILVRFRKHRIAFTCDITKMYRQVILNENDRDYHRFFWRSNPNEELLEYRMKVVTFGVASSSYQAQRCLQQLSVHTEAQYPLASSTVKRDFYMDDCLTGTYWAILFRLRTCAAPSTSVSMILSRR
ncbi:Uncharacterised protein r2_g268 [Pycnogonum litorale]